MHEETFEGRDGTQLFARIWRPDGPARGIVALVHGFKAHSGVFEWAARQLVSHDLVVYALDLRGHGRSGGERLYVEKYEDYVADVDALVRLARSREPGLPVFLLGHSAGGIISTAYALEHQSELAGFVCESFAQETPAPPAVLALIKGIAKLAPHLGVLDLKDEQFSRDRRFVDRMNRDPLILHQRYPTKTVAALAVLEEKLARDFPKMTMPVMILHGTKDAVTVPRGSELFYRTAGSSDKTLRLYEGHYHDLLNDLGREEVMGEITRWIDDRIPSA